MHPKAISSAEESLSRMKSAASRLEGANILELKQIWSNILVDAHRIYSKLEQGAKTNNKSKIWFSEAKHLRNIDSLLRYLHHARNVDEHGIEEIVQTQMPSVSMIDGYIDFMRIEISAANVSITHGPKTNMELKITPPSIRIVSVSDRGVVYDPPSSFKGKYISPLNLVNLIELSISHFEELMSEARKLMTETP